MSVVADCEGDDEAEGLEVEDGRSSMLPASRGGAALCQ